MKKKLYNAFFLASGTGRSAYALTSFDAALLDAKVGDVNIVRMSSIVPPGCRQTETAELFPGDIVPMAYASCTSDNSGSLISAAVAAAIPDKFGLPGVIMEDSGVVSEKECLSIVKKMAEEAMHNRGIKDFSISSASSSAEVFSGTHTTVFAGVVLYDEGVYVADS